LGWNYGVGPQILGQNGRTAMSDVKTNQKSIVANVLGPDEKSIKPRKPYSTPKLTPFGALAAKTLGTSGTSTEGVNMPFHL